MKKIIIVVVLIFLLLQSTQVAFAYFEEENEIILDENNQLYVINQTMSNNTELLIPQGAILTENETYVITYQYEIIVEQDMDIEAKIADLYLETDVMADEIKQVFNFDISFDHIGTTNISNGFFSNETIGNIIVVTVEISMNNIEDFDYYLDIYSKEISFSFVLTLSKSFS